MEFDYYMFIDYSEDFLGYNIIEKANIKELLSRISKFGHYSELKHKSAYIHSIKRVIDNKDIMSYILKCKIRMIRETPEIYSDILDFIKKNDNCLVFISIDNKQYSNFEKLVNIIDGKNIKIIKESQLKRHSKEYKMSLIIDTLLNIERLKNERQFK